MIFLQLFNALCLLKKMLHFSLVDCQLLMPMTWMYTYKGFEKFEKRLHSAY